jgi:DNA-directed RNA polymerase specialized sigma subunit
LETKGEKRKKDILRDEVQDKESKQEVLQQEDIATNDVRSWRDLKTVMQVVVLDSSSEDEDDVYVVVDDIQGSEMEMNEPLVQPEDCKDIGISELFSSQLSYCMNCSVMI